MRELKFSGRERAVIRAIDFTTGTLGEEIFTHTKIELEDLVDILNGLISSGYAEAVPYAESTSLETFQATLFEINPSYALDIRAAIAHR